MIQRHALGPALLVALMAAACSSPDEPKQVTPKGPQFDADYYSKNAKEYVDAGHYAQAKDQWEKQLQKDPENWMAHMGIAYSDYYLSEQSVVQHRNLDEARSRLTAAEKRFRQLRSGPLEADTLHVDPKRPQWKAELGLALTMRRLGYVDHLEGQQSLQLAKRGGADATKAADRAAELGMSSERSYGDAIALFTGLAYMQHASPEAIRNLAELYVVTKQDAMAEREYRRFLDIAGRTYEEYTQKKKEDEKAAMGPDQKKAVTTAWDAQLDSNAQKQVQVMTDLAAIASARADYAGARTLIQEALKIQPDRRDLYLKLAEIENKLDMLETALVNVDEFLKRASQKREDFSDEIAVAMKLKSEIEKKLKERGIK